MELGFEHHKLDVHPRSPGWNLPFAVENLGAQDLKWHSVPKVPWLRLRPDKGVVKGRKEASVDIILSAENIKPGAYTGKITINAPGAINALQDVVVEMNMLKETDPEPPSSGIVMDTP